MYDSLLWYYVQSLQRILIPEAEMSIYRRNTDIGIDIILYFI